MTDKLAELRPVRSSDEVISVVLFWCAIVGGSLAFAGYVLRAEFWVTPTTPAVLTGLSDAIYKTMKIFGLVADLSGQDDGSLRFALSTVFIHVARFLAPVAFLGMVLRVLRNLVHPHLQRRRLARLSGHTIVCGTSAVARAFVANLLRADPSNRHRCVIVEHKNLESARSFCKQLGIELLEADARVLSTFARTHAAAAARVIVAGGTDSDNLDIMEKFATSTVGRTTPGALRLHVAIENDTLLREFANRTVVFRKTENVDIRPFNVAALVARRFFLMRNLMADAALCGQTRVHLVLVGFDDTLLQILLQFARICPFAGLARPAVTVLVPNPARSQESLDAAYPELGARKDGTPDDDVLDMTFLAWAPEAGGLKAETMAEVERRAQVSGIFVSLGEESLNSRTALLLRTLSQREARWRAPIYVNLQGADGLGRLLQTSEEAKAFADVIEPLPGLDNVCRVEMLEGRGDEVARLLHEGYLKLKGLDVSGPDAHLPGQKPWPSLEEAYRAANRRAADHVPMKLASAGFYITGRPFVSDPGAPIALADQQIETLAALEHASWAHGQKLAGWRYGALRDDRRRYHPALRPYETLPTAVQDFDREQVRLALSLVKPAAAGETVTVFRERRIGLAGLADMALSAMQPVEMAPQELSGLLQKYDKDWLTFVAPLASAAEMALAQSVIEHLDRAGHRRWRLVIPMGVPFEMLSAAAEASLRAWFMTRRETAWLIDLTPPGLRREDWHASPALVADGLERTADYIARTCSQILVRPVPGARTLPLLSAWTAHHPDTRGFVALALP